MLAALPNPLVATWSALALAMALGSLWLVSLRLRDSSIVDVFWGFGFVLVAVIGYTLGEGDATRRGLVLVLAALWGLRLTTYLAWRNWGRGEDKRYAEMRQAHGERWWIVSLFQVFALQGLLIFWVSLPLQVAQSLLQPGGLTLFDALGIVLVLAGLSFETIGDAQLARFKADPANAGRVMDQGLWSYTRHPNYFGDCLVWWGFYCIAAATDLGAWTIGSPIVMTVLLRRVSGVTLTERMMAGREGYAEYVRRTSPFVPRPPEP